jgi:apolipoprotein N-acyltransferase
VLYADVEMRTGDTWYTQLGDGPLIWLLALVFAASWLLARRDRRRSA